MAAMGTTGRDDGWHSGVIFSDIDLIRLNDGRFLSVIREHTTRQSFYAHSRNDGLRWMEIRPTEFKGANIKLFQLRSGNIICTYRNEDPKHRGVSCSVTEDGGETWQINSSHVTLKAESHVVQKLRILEISTRMSRLDSRDPNHSSKMRIPSTTKGLAVSGMIEMSPSKFM